MTGNRKNENAKRENVKRAILSGPQQELLASRFHVSGHPPHFVFCAHLIRMSAISGLENSFGGRWPALSSSRTLVPLGAILCSGPWGQVLLDTTAAQVLHQAVCSNFRMVTPISSGLN